MPCMVVFTCAMFHSKHSYCWALQYNIVFHLCPKYKQS
uniref:Uncharacterized protein n=1 Tax=Arundo donax TaxID=35708 RepID=A0A0A8Y120_ARUDO